MLLLNEKFEKLQYADIQILFRRWLCIKMGKKNFCVTTIWFFKMEKQKSHIRDTLHWDFIMCSLFTAEQSNTICKFAIIDHYLLYYKSLLWNILGSSFWSTFQEKGKKKKKQHSRGNAIKQGVLFCFSFALFKDFLECNYSTSKIRNLYITLSFTNLRVPHYIYWTQFFKEHLKI